MKETTTQPCNHLFSATEHLLACCAHFCLSSEICCREGQWSRRCAAPAASHHQSALSVTTAIHYPCLSPEGSDLLLLIRLALLQLAGEAAVSKVFPKKRKTCSQTVKGYSYIKSLSALQRKQNNIFSLAAKPVWRQTFSLPSSLFFMVLQKWGKYWLIG